MLVNQSQADRVDNTQQRAVQFISELQPVYSLALYQPRAAFIASPVHSAGAGAATAIFFLNGTFRLYELPRHLGQQYAYISTALWAGPDPDAAVAAVSAAKSAVQDGVQLQGFDVNEVPPPEAPRPPAQPRVALASPVGAGSREAPAEPLAAEAIDSPAGMSEGGAGNGGAARIWQPLVVVFSLGAELCMPLWRSARLQYCSGCRTLLATSAALADPEPTPSHPEPVFRDAVLERPVRECQSSSCVLDIYLM